MESENKGLIDVRDCPCDGCPTKPCGHPARCVKFTLWLNKTVDAVPVVRCKDCKYFIPKVDGTVGFCKCGEVCGYCTSMRVADDFCSYGERGDVDG